MLLHFLTVLAPLATIIIVSGAISWKTSLKLVLFGLLAAAATFQLDSVVAASGSAHVEYGAPLPYARAAWDLALSQRKGDPTPLPANLIGDVVFWCSSTVVIGTLLRWVALRLVGGATRDGVTRRPPPRRRPRRDMFRRTQVRETQLRETQLRETQLREARLRQTRLHEAQLREVRRRTAGLANASGWPGDCVLPPRIA